MQEDHLQQQFSEILLLCVERGMELPLHLTTIGANGSALVARYTPAVDGQWDVTVLSQYVEDGAFTLPVNVMVCDARGGAARIVIENGRIALH